jgi:hypothetical protein
MQRTDEEVINFIAENKANFQITITGSLKDDEQFVEVNFYNTEISIIEPALGFAISENEVLLKGFLGGIMAEFEHFKKVQNANI